VNVRRAGNRVTKGALGLVPVLLVVFSACSDLVFDDPSRLKSFDLSPLTLSFDDWGEAELVSAAALDVDGQTFPGTITWTSSDPSVVTVDAAGVVRSVANGTATVRAEIAGLSGQVSVTVDAAGPYNLDMILVTQFSPGRLNALRAVERRIETVIRDELPSVDFRVNTLPAGTCSDTQQPVAEVIDDLRVFVGTAALDGVGGAFAQAGPCVVESSARIPAVGVIRIDEADVDAAAVSDADFEKIVLHEMLHVLGFGTLWVDRDLLRDPTLPDSPDADVHFSGESAIVEFDAAGGAAYQGGKVPVENEGGAGAVDGHWRETQFGAELMTAGGTVGESILMSRITLASLGDVGYTVDFAQADDFEVQLAAPVSPRGDAGVDLSGDRLIVPLIVRPAGELPWTKGRNP
jgi:leishmanolysin/Big-like domain-containing protein